MPTDDAARATAPSVEPVRRWDDDRDGIEYRQRVPAPEPVAGLREARTALTDEEAETVVKALAIGRVSYDGDPWFAKDAGYDYDDAEQTLDDASAILRRFADTLR